MKHFIDAMDSAVKNENWHGAIFIALSLPDICGKIDRPNEGGSKIRYSTWFDDYVSERFRDKHGTGNLSGRDCYALRCALLHEGSDQTDTQQASEVLEKIEFNCLTPVLTYHNVISQCGKKLQLNVKDFCRDIKFGVEKWLRVVSSEAEIQRKLSSLLNVRNLNYENPYGTAEERPDWSI